MPSIEQRVAERYARSQVQKAQEIRGGSEKTVQSARSSDEPQQPVQATHDDAGSGRRRASTSRDSGPVALQRHFIRKAMGIEIELDITMDELAELWRNRDSLGIVAYNQKDKPQEADVEVDGQSMDTDWDEPAADWMDEKKAEEKKAEEKKAEEKKAAARKVMACLMNDTASLPDLGRQVERIVRGLGTVDIYFDDGSFVSAQVEDPQAQTGGHGCGCKKASCIHTGAATVDMVAAVKANRELLGARDSRKVGVKTPRWWAYQTEPPFDLWLLRDVPMVLARDLADFPERAARLRNPRQGWTIAREFADKSPFQRRR